MHNLHLEVVSWDLAVYPSAIRVGTTRETHLAGE